jgi:hypothetical protein
VAGVAEPIDLGLHGFLDADEVGVLGAEELGKPSLAELPAISAVVGVGVTQIGATHGQCKGRS